MHQCEACGKRITAEARFCPWCGAEVASEPRPLEPEAFPDSLRAKLDASLREYTRLLNDLESGALGQAELRARALDAGVVRWESQLWILDLEAGRWWRYDGLRLDPAVEAETG